MAADDGNPNGVVGVVDIGAVTADDTRDSTGASWNPAIHATGSDGKPTFRADGTFRSRRGSGGSSGDAPTAARTRRISSATAATIPVDSYAGMLRNMHIMLAASLRVPELEIAEPQAKALAVAIAEVQAQYVGNTDPRTTAWMHLAVVAGSLYGGIYMRVKQREFQEAQSAAA